VLKRLDDAERLIQLLTLYPGLTQRALVAMHGIAPSLIYRCIEQGLIISKEQVVGHRSGYLHVFRFYVANKGVSKCTS
jgi:hypothetical protein